MDCILVSSSRLSYLTHGADLGTPRPSSNAINGTNVYIIYAQTPKFSIAGAACTDEQPPVTAAPTCAAPTATVTATVTVRGNSTLLVPTATPTATGAPLGHELVAKSKYEGECPEVIGWSGGYDSPVKLTEIPRAGSSGQSSAAQVGSEAGLTAATNGKVKSNCASKKRRVRRHA